MTTDVILSLAERLRAEREQQGLTLDQLAARTGLSKAYLSRLESAERQPAIGTLLDLARSLGVTVSSLLGEDDHPAALGLHPPTNPSHESNGLLITACSGYAGARDLEAIRVTIPVDRPVVPFSRHRGEEWLHVLAGTVRLEYADQTHLIEAGTSAHFDADRPHRLSASSGPAELLLVATTTWQSLPPTHP
jgi:transcriptional regulator with XRE-family HTH domain